MAEVVTLARRTAVQDTVADRMCALDCLWCPMGADGWRQCKQHGEPCEKADTAIEAVAYTLAGDEALARAIGRQALTAVVQHLRGR